MPLQATSGAASYDAFGGGVPFEPVYIEQIFQTWLYTGNGSTQTITNGIDLEGKGGLVWIKDRNNSNGHYLTDTARGVNSQLRSHSTAAATTSTDYITSFNASGFEIGTNGNINTNGNTQVAWTFRKAPKFFDVVTYTGNGTAGRTVSHNLGSVPGCIIIKRTDAAMNWYVYHRYDPTKYLVLNQTAAAASFAVVTATSDTTFTLPADGSTNGNGSQYVAYLFAHNAGGFGLSGTDNVISCGSWTGTGTTPGPVVTLGYEPQWVIWKRTDAGTESWHIRDVMRGMPVTASGQDLYADLASATGNTTNEGLIPTATGFQVIGTNTNANTNGGTYIYIAIRRGPMKVPTTGTSVYMPLATPATTEGNVGFPADLAIAKFPTGSQDWLWGDRLRNAILYSNSTVAENAGAGGGNGPKPFDTQNGVKLTGITATDYDFWMMRRAPGFFDEVCYTGTGVDGQTFVHNLGVAPELTIIKRRSGAADWPVRALSTRLLLNSTGVSSGANGSITDTSSTTFTVSEGASGFNAANASGSTYVAYLFASCPGVSKVGSYTGNGSSQTINCGFTGGARFVMIKRTDSTGNWCVWDTARGIVAGNDPTLALNLTDAEATGYDFIDTNSSGFVINQVSAPGSGLAGNMNVSGASYIFLAIA